MEYKKLKYNELKDVRERLHTEQNGVCPILKIEMSLSDAVVDHKHVKKGETIGDNGVGLIRGCIHKNANTVEGKILSSYRRYGIEKTGVSLPEFLRNLADYLEQEPLPYIHPVEITKINKRIRLKKSSYNELKKIHSLLGIKAKLPLYNEKTKKLTKSLSKMYERCGMEPEFYKN